MTRLPKRIAALLWLVLLSMLCLNWAGAGRAQDGTVPVLASPALIDSGILKFVLPRFSLKTGVSVDVQQLDPASFSFSEPAIVLTESLPPPPGWNSLPLLQDMTGKTYHMLTPSAPARAIKRLADWLVSETGRRTIAQFEIDGAQAFSPADAAAVRTEQRDFRGNAGRGQKLAYTHCGRCHVIGDKNRMKGIGSTPSFGALRALPDWEDRFTTFYVRNPHPALVQVSGITTPFTSANPSPIAPLEITQAEMDDILAFVAALEPADLGAPVRHQ